MSFRCYLLLAIVAFVIAVTGSDMVAKMSVSDLSIGEAFDQHLEWASLTTIGILLLFAPYAAAALICARLSEHSRSGVAAILFAVALIVLSYFYFGGFHAAEQAMVDERWTAAALSIGLLPFWVGVPLVLALIGAALIAKKLRPETDI
jgi:uncharacterized membrane protein YhaH (DUF805 family)